MRVELKEMEQMKVTGGKLITGNTYETKVSEGYLALRDDIGYNYNNEIGALCNGSLVMVIGDPIGDYVLVAVESQADGVWNRGNVVGCVGYVNKNCLQ